MDPVYNDAFYASVGRSARKSARVVVPRVIDLLHPKSVVDMGCGSGEWAGAFAAHGCRVTGVDGPAVDPTSLVIPNESFAQADLSAVGALEKLPSRCGKFDLAVCLEVAEHLPDSTAEPLVGCLTSLADAVLFSAAVPGQGGTEHINERWPQYWARLFRQAEFVACDVLRIELWTNKNVAWWYAQNMVIFLRSDHSLLPQMASAIDEPSDLISLVHPELLIQLQRQHQSSMGFSNLVRRLPRSALDGVQRRWQFKR